MKEQRFSQHALSAVIFDVGGVLLHPNGELIAQTLAPMIGYKIDTQLCQDSYYLTDFQLYGQSLDKNCFALTWGSILGLPPDLSLPAWEKVNKLDYEIPNLWSYIEPCAVKMLRLLRTQGYKLGVLSNANGNVEQLLTVLGLAKFFDDIIDSSVVGLKKPDPRAFSLAASRLDIDLAAGVYVGDGLTEVQAGRELGMYGILYDKMMSYGDSISIQNLCQLQKRLAAVQSER